MNNTIQRLAALAITVLAAATLAGCASGAHKDNMAVAAPVATGKKFSQSVQVVTGGGNDTGVMDSSNISNADLKTAVETSIAKSGLFRSVSASGGDYTLGVTVIQLSKPTFGGAFTVDLEAGWTLTRNSDKSVLLRKSVRSTATATMGDSLVGVTRLRLAVEGAARNNIEQGLKAVSELPL